MKNKLLALKLLKQKIHDPSLTFSLISGVRQLKIHKSSKSDLIVAFFMSTP